MTTDEFYEGIAKLGLWTHPTDEDALGLMLLLHTYDIELGEIRLSDRPAVSRLAATTQRHAAELIASAWPGRNDLQRTRREHWFMEFNVTTPHEVIDDIPSKWMIHVDQVRSRLESSGSVAGFVPAD